MSMTGNSGKTLLVGAVLFCLCGSFVGCGAPREQTGPNEAPSIQNSISAASDSISPESIPPEAVASEAVPSESIPPESIPSEAVASDSAAAENSNKISAEEVADTFGIPIVLPENPNWIEDAEYYLEDEDHLKITYHDLIADADCTLLVSRNDHLDLPTAEYDETLAETWEGITASGERITVSARHEKDHENMTLAVWEYKEYQFAIMGEDDANVVIPKTALNIIENLD